jgi:hypothetical protein
MACQPKEKKTVVTRNKIIPRNAFNPITSDQVGTGYGKLKVVRKPE